jgi:hypothetical protein
MKATGVMLSTFLVEMRVANSFFFVHEHVPHNFYRSTTVSSSSPSARSVEWTADRVTP